MKMLIIELNYILLQAKDFLRQFVAISIQLFFQQLP